MTESQTPFSDFMRWLFDTPEKKRSMWEIIVWWEARRLAYNGIVGSVGFCSLLAFLFFIESSHFLRSGEDAVEPLALLFAPIAINICYTAGWLVEAFLNAVLPKGSGRKGVFLLKAGLAFSLLVVLLPSVLWGGVWIGQQFRHLLP